MNTLNEHERTQRLRFWRLLQAIMADRAIQRGTYTQADLAADLGVTGGTITKYSKLKINPMNIQASILAALSQMLGVQALDILHHIADGKPLVVDSRYQEDEIKNLTKALATPHGIATALRILAAAIDGTSRQCETGEKSQTTPMAPIVPSWYSDLLGLLESQLLNTHILKRIIHLAASNYHQLTAEPLDAESEKIGQQLAAK